MRGNPPWSWRWYGVQLGIYVVFVLTINIILGIFGRDPNFWQMVLLLYVPAAALARWITKKMRWYYQPWL